MLKKIDIAKKFYSSNINNIQCPICGLVMNDNLELLTCNNRHHFNLAKQGYFNFVSRKVNSDYTKEMLRHRRKVINSYVYQPLVEVLNKILSGKSGLLVDAGCGEGSFTELLNFNDGFKLGIDLSRDGVMLATDYNLVSQGFAVADLTHLPLNSQTVDIVVNMLSPAMYQEFDRVLKKDGLIIKVIPSTNYLKELRDLNYRGTSKEQYSNDDIKTHFLNHMDVVENYTLSYTVELDSKLALDVLKMSPLTWNIEDVNLKEQVNFLTNLTIDVEILVGRSL